MTKRKMKKKDVHALGLPVFKVGYCDLQNLLQYESPFAYSTRAEGWACDFYEVNGVILSTGYAPTGVAVTPYAIVREYDDRAIGKTREQRDELIREFTNTLKKGV